MTEHPTTVDDCIATLPNAIQRVVERVRQAIGVALPEAEERIRYGMPAVMLFDRYALHYAGRKQHIGPYPIPGSR